MIQETSTFNAATIGAFGALLGAGVSAIVLMLNGWRQRKHERELAEERNRIQIREKIRETALNIALKEWEHHLNVAARQGYEVSGPDAYIFRYHQILTMMEENNLTPETVAKIQLDTIAVSNASHSALEKYRKEHNLPAP